MKKYSLSLIALSVILLDQLSKFAALNTLGSGLVAHVLPGLNFSLAFNRGVAFSFFYDTGAQSPWFLIAMTSVLSVIILVMLLNTPPDKKYQQITLAMILGGALSNIFDRIYYKAVIDFIDVYLGTHHWPVFNLADSAICLGAFFLIWNGLQEKS